MARTTENPMPDKTQTVDMGTDKPANKPADKPTGNGNLPTRKVMEGPIRSRRGRPQNMYTEWAGEVEDLKRNLGKSFEYEGTQKASTVARGLQRVYGIIARTRNLNKEDGTAILCLQYPEKDGKPDETQVEEIKAKYATD